MRSNDGLIIRVTQENNATMKAYFPTENITYTIEGSLLKTIEKDKDFRGNIINEQIIHWTLENEDGKFDKSFKYFKEQVRLYCVG